MIKKFAKLILRQPPFLIRMVIIFIFFMVVVSEILVGISQSKELARAKERAALVNMIPEMERKLNRYNLPQAVPIMTESMTLEGTFVRGDILTALINGRIVKEGDILGDYKVIKINRNFVTLENSATHETKNLQMQKD